MSDKTVVLTAELALNPCGELFRSALCAIAYGEITCIPTAELARLRARVAELESSEPVAWYCKDQNKATINKYCEDDVPLFLGPQRISEGWQPIESAPVTESVLLIRKDGHMRIDNWGSYITYNVPEWTHWMPLPAPPIPGAGA